MSESSVSRVRILVVSYLLCVVSQHPPTWPICRAFLSVFKLGCDMLNYFLSCCSQHQYAMTSFYCHLHLLKCHIWLFNGDLHSHLHDILLYVVFNQVTVLTVLLFRLISSSPGGHSQSKNNHKSYNNSKDVVIILSHILLNWLLPMFVPSFGLGLPFLSPFKHVDGPAKH